MIVNNLDPLFLYDDDCGICTKVSHFIGRLLNVKIMKMHESKLMKEGYLVIGEENYWKSFHIVKNNEWFTEEEALIALSSLFPLGGMITKIASTPPILFLLSKLLNNMQIRRDISCEL